MKNLLPCFVFILLLLADRSFAQASDIISENIPAVSELSMNVYPNPNPGNEARVDFKGFEASNLLVVVYDMLGREMYTKIQMVEKDGFLFSFDPALPKGVYLIIASANDTVFRQKLIVK